MTLTLTKLGFTLNITRVFRGSIGVQFIGVLTDFDGLVIGTFRGFTIDFIEYLANKEIEKILA